MSNLVYSTAHGRVCPDCRRPKADCVCREKRNAKKQKSDGVVRIGRQTKGRKGKGVTIVTGLPLSPNELKDVAKKCKQLCGGGGTVRDSVIEIQGEHRDKLVKYFESQGYTVKRSGG